MPIRVNVRVTPRASADEVRELDDAGVLHVRVTAPPAEGRANERVVALVARALGIPRRDVIIVAGQRGRDKQVELPFTSVDEVRSRLFRHR